MACGGQTGDRPDGGASPEPDVCAPIAPITSGMDSTGGPVDCQALSAYEISTLEDFETGDAVGWQIANDQTARQSPAPETDPIVAESIPGGRCLDTPGMQSQYALHILSGSFASYGGAFSRKFARRILNVTPCPVHPCWDRPIGLPPMGPCGSSLLPSTQPGAPSLCLTGTDASTWEGVVLWARKGRGSSSNIRVQLGDVHTDESNQACECAPSGTQADPSQVCDPFGMPQGVDETFRPYLFPFRLMRQSGHGQPSPNGLDTSELFTIAVTYGTGAWDLWIDDIAFYRTKP